MGKSRRKRKNWEEKVSEEGKRRKEWVNEWGKKEREEWMNEEENRRKGVGEKGGWEDEGKRKMNEGESKKQEKREGV